MLGEKLGHVFDRPLESIAIKIPFHPNTLTITGFLVTVAASLILASDLVFGGILVMAGGIFDVLDGVVARVNGKKTRFGAFLDSVLDRLSDALILLAIGWNFFNRGSLTGVVLCLVTLVGSFLISYTRARAEGLGEDCKHGLMERPERIVLIAFGAVSGLMTPVLWALVILTHITVFQRIIHVWKVMGRR